MAKRERPPFIGFYTNEEMKEKLIKIAEKEELGISDIVRRAVRLYVKQCEEE